MRLHELITEAKPLKLRHPVVGDVNWGCLGPVGCCVLYWDHGPEANWPLIADESVLLDDTWELRDEKPLDVSGN